MSNVDNMVQELLREYQRIQNVIGNQPEWAVHKRTNPTELVHCTIPFVGKNIAYKVNESSYTPVQKTYQLMIVSI